MKAIGTAFVRQWVMPKDPRTNDQIRQRGRLMAAVVAWKKLSDDEKKKYHERARFMKRTGYHLFTAEFMSEPA